jgi:uncharacterized protein (DUF1330 family)
MKSQYKVAMALMVGTAIGAAAIEGLHAQAKLPAYAIVAVRSITDADAYKNVIAKAPAAVAGSGGHFEIRTDKITSLYGPPPQRFVLIAFDNIEQAQAWHNSAAQKEVDALVAKSSDSLSFIVEGVAKPPTN